MASMIRVQQVLLADQVEVHQVLLAHQREAVVAEPLGLLDMHIDSDIHAAF